MHHYIFMPSYTTTMRNNRFRRNAAAMVAARACAVVTIELRLGSPWLDGGAGPPGWPPGWTDRRKGSAKGAASPPAAPPPVASVNFPGFLCLPRHWF